MLVQNNAGDLQIEGTLEIEGTVGWISESAVSPSQNQWELWAENHDAALLCNSLHERGIFSWVAQEFRSVYVKSSQVNTKGRVVE